MPCLTDTAANGKREECGRVFCSFIRPQIAKRQNAAVLPASPIRPQMKKDRAAAVRIAHLYGRKYGNGGMRPYHLPRLYGRNWKKAELRPYGTIAAVKSRPCVPDERCLEKTCEGKMNNRRNKQRKGIVRAQPGTEFSRKTVFHGNTRSAFLLLPRTPRLTATDYGRFSIINAISN